MGMCRAVGTHPLPGHETSEGVGTHPWTWDLRGCYSPTRHGTSGEVGTQPNRHGIQRDTIGKWVVRFLLECFLVTSCVKH